MVDYPNQILGSEAGTTFPGARVFYHTWPDLREGKRREPQFLSILCWPNTSLDYSLRKPTCYHPDFAPSSVPWEMDIGRTATYICWSGPCYNSAVDEYNVYILSWILVVFTCVVILLCGRSGALQGLEATITSRYEVQLCYVTGELSDCFFVIAELKSKFHLVYLIVLRAHLFEITPVTPCLSFILCLPNLALILFSLCALHFNINLH